jgi:hypothetical protein
MSRWSELGHRQINKQMKNIADCDLDRRRWLQYQNPQWRLA